MGHGARPPFRGIVSRSTNADAQAREGLSAQVLDRAPQTVMASSTALGPQPQTPQGDVHVIHQNQQLFRREAKPVERCTDGPTTVVHVGLRHEQPQSAFTDAVLRRQTMQLVLLTKTEPLA